MQNVIAGAAEDLIVSRAALQHVVTVFAVQRVVAASRVYRVVARRSVDNIVAIAWNREERGEIRRVPYGAVRKMDRLDASSGRVVVEKSKPVGSTGKV